MDAFQKTYWNLRQVLAWVSLGDRQLVQKASDGETERGTFHLEVFGPGGKREWVKKSAGEMEKVDFLVEFTMAGGDGPGLQTAKDEVLAAAQEGQILIHGLENGEGDLKEIPAVQWASLEFSPNLERADPKQTPRSGRPRRSATHWHGLKFNRPEVQQTWADPLAGTLPAGSADQKLHNEAPQKPKGKGGRKAGPYRSHLWKWLRWIDKTKPPELYGAARSMLATEYRKRAKRDTIKGVPKRIALDDAIRKELAVIKRENTEK